MHVNMAVLRVVEAWSFRLRSPTKNVYNVFLVVTISEKGDNPNCKYLIQSAVLPNDEATK